MKKLISFEINLLVISLCLFIGTASVPKSVLAGRVPVIDGATTTYDVTIFGTFVPVKTGLNTYAFLIRDQKKFFRVKNIQVHLTRPGSNIQGPDMNVLKEIAPSEIRLIGKQDVIDPLMENTTGKSYTFDGILSVSDRYLFITSTEVTGSQGDKGGKP